MNAIINHSSLFGKRIAITRPLAQSEDFVEALQIRGAIPVIFPTIQIMPLADPTPLDTILQRLSDYDWVVFTSVNGVSATVDRLQATGLGTEALNQCRIAAIGPVTAESLEAHGVHVDCVPEEYVAESLVTAITGSNRGSVTGQRFLLLRAETARPVLPQQLIALGAQATEISVYRTGCGVPESDAYTDLRAGVDAITFTSSSTVHCFCELLGKEASTIAAKATIACIGPITAGTARERNLHVDTVATEYTVLGLIAALEDWFAVRAMTA